MTTCALGDRRGDARATWSFSSSERRRCARCFGSATTRQLTLFTSPFGPSVENTVTNFACPSGASASAAFVRRLVSSSDVPGGELDVDDELAAVLRR